jgi:glucokinase-like ROK family protein
MKYSYISLLPHQTNTARLAVLRKHTTGDQELVRKLNTAVILDCLRFSSSLSRADLSHRTSLNRSTVSSIISELIDKGLVRETELQKDKLGRPGMSLELDPNGGAAVGVEIGVDFISVLLTDFVAKPYWRKRIQVDPTSGQPALLAMAEALIQEALQYAEVCHAHLLGIGVGVPGLIDVQRGTIVVAPNLNWHDIPLRQMWTQLFNLPVFVENDANAAALGEYYFGVAREVKNFIYLSADVGLGGGIVLDGKLFRGHSGYAGEVGHMTIEPNGLPCSCGRRGCWETLVGLRGIVHQIQVMLQNGATSLIRDLVQGDLNNITFEQVVAAAEAGDAIALNALYNVAKWLGIGIANLVNVFNPEMVVLGGGLARGSKLWEPVLGATVHEFAWKQSLETLQLTTSAHGTEACVVGTVALVLDDILRYPALS